MPSASALGAAAPSGPLVTLTAATSTVTIEHYPDEPLWFFDLGVYAVTGGADLAVRTTRPNYRTPLRSDLILTTKGRASTTRLPKGLVTDFGGLTGFTSLTLKDSTGATVSSTQQTWCPGTYGSSRMRPDAAATSPYPTYCQGSPWALGGVTGVPAHWASSLTSFEFGNSEPLVLPDGTYTATTTITEPWRKVVKTPKSTASVSVTVVVKTIPLPDGGGGGVGAAAAPQGVAAANRAAAAGQFPREVPANLLGRVDGLLPRTPQGRGAGSGTGFTGPAAASTSSVAVPAGPAATPLSAAAGAMSTASAKKISKDHRPDLRSLPAFGIAVIGDWDDPLSTREYLGFAATTWNAGPAPLVVDGYRRPGAEVMDAYQFFYDSKGRQVGYTPTGTLAYDPRLGHTHWHFKDFAKYELVAADGTTQLSGKEAWCLAPTDAVDLTVKGARYQPYSTGLSTACGGQQAIALRETMDTGWGDTYGQFLPGQSFDITDVPNGTYVIRVTANPDGNLLEGNTANNVSDRTVILGGTPGARTVTVPPHEGLDIP